MIATTIVDPPRAHNNSCRSCKNWRTDRLGDGYRPDIAFDLKALPARDAYLITTREPVLAGMYAFHAQDVLNEEDERVLLNLPKEMQVAFPFEVM